MSNDSQCDYCHGVGACPKCWGRAGITKIESEVASLRAAREYAVERVRERVDCGARDLCKMSPPCSWHVHETAEATVVSLRAELDRVKEENERMRSAVAAIGILLRGVRTYAKDRPAVAECFRILNPLLRQLGIDSKADPNGALTGAIAVANLPEEEGEAPPSSAAGADDKETKNHGE